MYNTDEVDRYIETEVNRLRIPGLALAVLSNGDTIDVRSYGFANVELGVPVSLDTVFDIASMTKPFTAMAVLMLMEAGKVGLDNFVSEYIGEAPDIWNGITIRHLLTHTAGLAASCEGTIDGVHLLDYSAKRLLSTAAAQPLDHNPGERYSYSDLGYFLLGLIVEAASGASYSKYVSTAILNPLGMDNTVFWDQSSIVPGRASGYTLVDGRLVHNRFVWNVGVPSYQGMFSTVSDLARWNMALCSGRLLTTRSIEEMWRPGRLNDGRTLSTGSGSYGLGWFLAEHGGSRLVEHGGMAGTCMTRFLDANLTILVLTNLDVRNGQHPRALTRGVFDVLVSSSVKAH